VGDRVLIGGVKEGTIAFIGTTQFASGIWAGIVLDTPEGKNNGSVKNVSYFQCPPNHGLFAKPDKLTLVPKPRPQQPAAPPTEDFKVNDRVMVDGEKIGVVSFIGPTQFAKGIWVGVTLDQAEGKNDGSVNNVQYFSCPPNHGLFTRTNKLSLVSTTPTLSGHGTSSASSFSAGELKMKAEQLNIGDRVLVNGAKEGTLQYIGPTHFAKGIWVGVELNEPQGKNDGSVSGKR
jgi:dynactin complex subunit